ncbi:MAG: ORF6N domain-containing protein [Bacilli bacterium]|nr:ORF6N domain-containing protein [Bacilli bacterium]
MSNPTPLVLLDESLIKDLIFEIRGQKVMLDFDLAHIYGYETRYFNRQVKNNIERFDDDFMFQLTADEVNQLLRCKNFTSRDNGFFSGQKGGTRKPPFAFTEQGIYMLMTVLRGDLAVRQSKTLIRLFKSMKDYIVETQSLGSTNEVLALANQVRTNTEKISKIEGKLDMLMDNFIDPSTYKSFLIMDGEKVESDVAYQRIYSMAKQRVYLIDDYIDVKTIHLLKSCNSGVRIIVFSDNKARNSLNQAFVADFIADRPDLHIEFKKTEGRFHDRYIILDYPGKTRVFHCGASSKDGGNKITTIMEVENPEAYLDLISDILSNEELILS